MLWNAPSLATWTFTCAWWFVRAHTFAVFAVISPAVTPLVKAFAPIADAGMTSAITAIAAEAPNARHLPLPMASSLYRPGRPAQGGLGLDPPIA